MKFRDGSSSSLHDTGGPGGATTAGGSTGGGLSGGPSRGLPVQWPPRGRPSVAENSTGSSDMTEGKARTKFDRFFSHTAVAASGTARPSRLRSRRLSCFKVVSSTSSRQSSSLRCCSPTRSARRWCTASSCRASLSCETSSAWKPTPLTSAGPSKSREPWHHLPRPGSASSAYPVAACTRGTVRAEPAATCWHVPGAEGHMRQGGFRGNPAAPRPEKGLPLARPCARKP
mmetsp:Transcript_62054/g.176263  ORF Transcript_62054/g.176263 Transcript_62054/m.176263 type:complete len:229 (-) Transcript_62054:31-717(-)